MRGFLHSGLRGMRGNHLGRFQRGIEKELLPAKLHCRAKDFLEVKLFRMTLAWRPGMKLANRIFFFYFCVG